MLGDKGAALCLCAPTNFVSVLQEEQPQKLAVMQDAVVGLLALRRACLGCSALQLPCGACPMS